MRKIPIFIIRLYQKTLSPDHGFMRYKHPYGFCRFYPSCSQYSIESFEKYGIIKGALLTIKRIIKCNPWQKPTIDTVPKKQP